MDNRFNTIAGWTLGAAIVALGASLVTGEVFKAERPEKMGYPIEGVAQEGEGGEAAQPVSFYLAQADVAAGEQRSEEHTSELQSRQYLVCRLLLEKKSNLPCPRACRD